MIKLERVLAPLWKASSLRALHPAGFRGCSHGPCAQRPAPLDALGAQPACGRARGAESHGTATLPTHGGGGCRAPWTPRCRLYLEGVKPLACGDEGPPLSALETLRDPCGSRRRRLDPRSPDPGLKTPPALGEQMSLVLKLIMDSRTKLVRCRALASKPRVSGGGAAGRGGPGEEGWGGEVLWGVRGWGSREALGPLGWVSGSCPGCDRDCPLWESESGSPGGDGEEGAGARGPLGAGAASSGAGSGSWSVRV